MKRILPLVLLLLALCGCTPRTESVAAPADPPVTVPTPTVQPPGLYAPDSALEAVTDGAVRVYPLQRTDSRAIATMGDSIVLFSGTDATTLTKYSGACLYPSASANLSCRISPDDAAVRISENGMTYYDDARRCLVFLDAQLEELRRLELPEGLCGTPALSEDLEALYYCTSDALRCLELSSGLDRLVKEMAYPVQTATKLHCGDSVLACSVLDADGNGRELYISTQTGQLLRETMGDVRLWTKDASYFAIVRDGVYSELLTGDSEQGPTLLTPHTYGSDVHPVLEIGGTVLASLDAQCAAVQLDYYDLLSGRRTNRLTLPDCSLPYSFRADETGNALWFLAFDAACECDALYRWDLTAAPIPDSVSCLSARYTAEKPDYQGLAACRATADRLCETYGVQILLWTDATAFEPWDYRLIPEYQVPVIRQNLVELERFLSLYPEGFFLRAAERTGCGRIQICLVRSIFGKAPASGSVDEAAGLQYWDDGANAYICLPSARDGLVQNACHEMFHIIETRVMTVCKAYDDWNALNPDGFQYDNDYVTNLTRKDEQWTAGSQRAFVDTYSMSYPKEDRARIMEFAMMPGNEDIFQTDAMQRKLRTLCTGIRQAFGSPEAGQSFLWEQYLKEQPGQA